MNLQQKISDALETLNLPVVKYINEYQGDYPILVYKEISNVPAFHADNRELTRRIMYQISIGTSDDEYEILEKLVEEIMRGLGFMRVDSQDIFDVIYWRVIRFTITEVNQNV